MRKFLTLSAIIAAVLSCQALAQNADDEKYIGIGARVRPAYEGADSSRVDVIPYLRLYGEHFFARTTQGLLEGGWRTRPLGAWVFGAQLAYEEGRISDESAFLEERHFEDLDASASLGLHAEGDWKIGAVPLNMLLRYRRDVKADNGAQADLRVTAGILDWGRLRAGVYGQLTWADGKSTQRYFGVTSLQSATSGLPAYSAGSGLRYAEVGLLGDVDLARHWIGLWGVSLQQSQGAARDSPIVQDRTNLFANAGIAYRF
jgi:outer membrane scaffolding protein for murein synthesis (MipA/OmpV family)